VLDGALAVPRPLQEMGTHRAKAVMTFEARVLGERVEAVRSSGVGCWKGTPEAFGARNALAISKVVTG
jgi:hypothetical protein